MSRIVLALTVSAAALFWSGVAAADGLPATPRGPKFYQSPTDEYQPPARRAPRARAPARATNTELGDLFLRQHGTPPPRLVEATRIYGYLPIAGPSFYYDAPVTPQVFDGAPCPTTSRYALTPLFECTLR